VNRPIAIQVEDVWKTFRVPEQRVDTLKERVVRPFQRVSYRTFEALKGVSFDVYDGEFFGIVGQNGSGKSTLLKIMASIYKADRGSVRVAGRVAPFIELGVGFNPEFTANENIEINGVLMGLTRREARARADRIIDFAELGEFRDLKVKNYSSGMMVRLAFAIMVEADADIMLIDEVLAVGDAGFAQKCMDVFRARKRAGKTVVLVTHDMMTVQSMCDRALVLDRGELVYIGDPDEAARHYLRINFQREGSDAPELATDGAPAGAGTTETAGGEIAVLRSHASLVRAWLERRGQEQRNLELGDPLHARVVLRIETPIRDPMFGFQLFSENGILLLQTPRWRLPQNNTPASNSVSLKPGTHVTLELRAPNVLAPGRYRLAAWIAEELGRHELAVQAIPALSFVVFGMAPTGPLLHLDCSYSATVHSPQSTHLTADARKSIELTEGSAQISEPTHE
jgi:ABC-2 type transport system ATP-binding protein